MLENQGIRVTNIMQFSVFGSGSLAVCFETASKATKSIQKIFNHMTSKKKVVFVVTLPNGASVNINMANLTHEEQLDIIDKAVGVIVSSKTEAE